MKEVLEPFETALNVSDLIDEYINQAEANVTDAVNAFDSFAEDLVSATSKEKPEVKGLRGDEVR